VYKRQSDGRVAFEVDAVIVSRLDRRSGLMSDGRPLTLDFRPREMGWCVRDKATTTQAA